MLIKLERLGKPWWLMPRITALARLRQENGFKFKASLVYIASTRLAGAVTVSYFFKRKKIIKCAKYKVKINSSSQRFSKEKKQNKTVSFFLFLFFLSYMMT